MAERVGFEPTVPSPVHVISNHADSATLAPLRNLGIFMATRRYSLVTYYLVVSTNLNAQRLSSYHGVFRATSKGRE